MIYLKQARTTPETDHQDVRDLVQVMLARIAVEGQTAVRDYSRTFDKWEGDLVVTRDHIAAATDQVPVRLRDDIRFAHDNIRRFAEAQRATLSDCAVEILPGLMAGQKQIPVAAAGCYVPGGRYSHVASAIMTITTAKVAGVPHIAACSPPRPGTGIPPAILYAMDMFAGPTDSMVLADSSADAEMVAYDLVGQAEHGYNSPVWLVTTDEALAQRVLRLVPGLIDTLPPVNRDSALQAWDNMAEVILCETREEMAQVADRYAPEHLHVQARDLDWWLGRLTAYGSLFLGEETTVAFGDKTSGPNHVLPTSGAARYTGGLSVHKFMKTVTWQRATRDAAKPLAEATARISRLEGMEGHARSADVRLRKFFPGESFNLGSVDAAS